MNRRRVIAAVLTLAGVSGGVRPARAQGTLASIAVDAVVINQTMTITTLRDLAFGTVIKGVATTILPTAGNSGEWEVAGSPNAFATITLALPTVLNNIQALPGSTMPVSFSATDALWRRSTNNPAGATVFDPSVGVTNARFGPPPTPFLYIWLGGTVNPAPTAKPGIYTGVVIVTVFYT